MTDLILERSGRHFDDDRGKTILITPPISKEYWKYRVKLYKEQAILGFPKFCSIGIGFALESDWNTNLPSRCEAEQICDHIWHNKKYKAITREQVIAAIKLIQHAVMEDV